MFLLLLTFKRQKGLKILSPNDDDMLLLLNIMLLLDIIVFSRISHTFQLIQFSCVVIYDDDDDEDVRAVI